MISQALKHTSMMSKIWDLYAFMLVFIVPSTHLSRFGGQCRQSISALSVGEQGTPSLWLLSFTELSLLGFHYVRLIQAVTSHLKDSGLQSPLSPWRSD